MRRLGVVREARRAALRERLTGGAAREARRRAAATSLQAHWRGLLGRRAAATRAEDEYFRAEAALRHEEAAVLVQACARGRAARALARRREVAALYVQCVQRGRSARAASEARRYQLAAATRLQAAWRGRVSR